MLQGRGGRLLSWEETAEGEYGRNVAQTQYLSRKKSEQVKQETGFGEQEFWQVEMAGEEIECLQAGSWGQWADKAAVMFAWAQ